MKRIGVLFKRILDEPFGFALLSNILTIFVGVFVFRPFFEESDDLTLALIAEGAYGVRDYHLIFSNAILGKMMVGLSSAFPTIRWFIVIQYVFAFVAMTSFAYMISHYKYGRIISLIIEASLLYEIYVSVQFSKTAALVGIIGCMILMSLFKNRQVDYEMRIVSVSRVSEVILTIIAFLLIIYSILLRGDAFKFVYCFAFMIFVIDLIGCRAKLREIAIGACGMVLILTIFGLLKIIDSSFYKENDWAYYKYYNYERSMMVDMYYDALDYGKYAQELAEMGVSENDAYVYITWQFADEKNLPPELMNKISSLTRNRKLDVDFGKAFVANVYNDLFVANPAILVGIIFILLLFFESQFLSSGFLAACGEIFATIVCFIYYHYNNCWSRRLVFMTIIVIVLTTAYIIATADDRYYASIINKESVHLKPTSQTLAVTFALSLITLLGMRLSNEFEYQEYQRNGKNFNVLQMYMEEEKDKLFVGDTFSIIGHSKYDLFNAMEEGSLDNFITCGSWLTASPIARSVVEKYGYFDPFDALRRGEGDVILIDNLYPDRKAVYLTEHGDGPRYAAEFIENVCGYNLYRIR